MRGKKIDLRNQDCIAGLRAVPAGWARLIFADPPYNLSGAGNQTVRGGRYVGCDKGEWDKIGDFDRFNLSWLAECIRVLADDGTLWVSGTLHSYPLVGVALKRLGMWIVNDVVWFKRNAPPVLSKNRLAPSTEVIWIAAKSKRYYFDYAAAKEMNGGKQMRNLWDIKAEKHLTPHPAEKPETLLTRIIRIGSAPGDNVLDPFMGSGTTGVVSHRLGRAFMGFEISPEYFDIARRRISRAPEPFFAGEGGMKRKFG